MYIIAKYDSSTVQFEYAKRIRKACEGHLIWVFKIAHYTEIWNDSDSTGNATRDSSFETSSNELSASRSVQIAYQILKLCLYLSMWEERWEFVLELLDLKLEDWLSYLANTRHMDNLWIERQSFETLRPYDTSSREGAFIEKLCPEYHLSDFTLLWLAFQQLENLVRSLDDKSNTQDTQHPDTVEQKIRRVRQSLDFYQDELNSREIQSNIIKTFKVSRMEFSTRSLAVNQVSSNSGTTITAVIRTNSATGVLSSPSSIGEQKMQPGGIVPVDLANELDTQVFAFQRTINENVFDVQSTDVATIEASVLGLFDETQEHIKESWRETLRIQEGNTIPNTVDPRQIALILFSSKFNHKLAKWNEYNDQGILYGRLLVSLYDSGAFAQMLVDGAPESMRSWTAATYETLSLLIASIYEECRISL